MRTCQDERQADRHAQKRRREAGTWLCAVGGEKQTPEKEPLCAGCDWPRVGGARTWRTGSPDVRQGAAQAAAIAAAKAEADERAVERDRGRETAREGRRRGAGPVVRRCSGKTWANENGDTRAEYARAKAAGVDSAQVIGRRQGEANRWLILSKHLGRARAVDVIGRSSTQRLRT